MRLWHEALIPYLDRQRLLGLHREVCALRGNGWGRKHSVVNYVFEHPFDWLVDYHFIVINEMHKRGYNVDELWLDKTYRGKKCEPYKAISKHSNSYQRYIYPEHNDKYLQECLDNLKTKGVEIEFKTNN